MFAIGFALVGGSGAYLVGKKAAIFAYNGQIEMAAIGIGLMFIVAGCSVTLYEWVCECTDNGGV